MDFTDPFIVDEIVYHYNSGNLEFFRNHGYTGSYEGILGRIVEIFLKGGHYDRVVELLKTKPEILNARIVRSLPSRVLFEIRDLLTPPYKEILFLKLIDEGDVELARRIPNVTTIVPNGIYENFDNVKIAYPIDSDIPDRHKEYSYYRFFRYEVSNLRDLKKALSTCPDPSASKECLKRLQPPEVIMYFVNNDLISADDVKKGYIEMNIGLFHQHLDVDNILLELFTGKPEKYFHYLMAGLPPRFDFHEALVERFVPVDSDSYDDFEWKQNSYQIIVHGVKSLKSMYNRFKMLNKVKTRKYFGDYDVTKLYRGQDKKILGMSIVYKYKRDTLNNIKISSNDAYRIIGRSMEIRGDVNAILDVLSHMMK